MASSVIASNAIWLSVYAMLSSNDIEAIARMAYLPRRIAVGDLSTMRLISNRPWRQFGRRHHVVQAPPPVPRGHRTARRSAIRLPAALVRRLQQAQHLHRLPTFAGQTNLT